LKVLKRYPISGGSPASPRSEPLFSDPSKISFIASRPSAGSTDDADGVFGTRAHSDHSE
jgi:hypothetical protein